MSGCLYNEIEPFAADWIGNPVRRTHELKTWPEPFQAVIDGRKRYEIRVDDRGFAVGDVLHLREWDPSPQMEPVTPWSLVMTERPRAFTGREAFAVVTYITPGGAWGLPANLCVMSLQPSPRKDGDQ